MGLGFLHSGARNDATSYLSPAVYLMYTPPSCHIYCRLISPFQEIQLQHEYVHGIGLCSCGAPRQKHECQCAAVVVVAVVSQDDVMVRPQCRCRCNSERRRKLQCDYAPADGGEEDGGEEDGGGEDCGGGGGGRRCAAHRYYREAAAEVEKDRPSQEEARKEAQEDDGEVRHQVIPGIAHRASGRSAELSGAERYHPAAASDQGHEEIHPGQREIHRSEHHGPPISCARPRVSMSRAFRAA